MSNHDLGWKRHFKKFLDQGWQGFVLRYAVVPYWNWRDPKPKLSGGPRPSPQPSESLQRMMNLVMPLKDPSPIGRAKAAMATAKNADEVLSGLDNLGTVHFARFVLIDKNICMISVYDGDFSNYIRDFITTIGSVFNDVLSLVEGTEHLIPTEHNVEEFIDWVHQHDLFQSTLFPTGLFDLQDEAKGFSPDRPPHEMATWWREFVLQLHANPNISLGSGYRAYPGFSAAQVRQKCGQGW